MNTVALIILNWNGKKDTLELLASVSKIDYPHLQVIIVDNGSKDGSVEAIRAQFPNIHIIENQENLGFAQGNNLGIQYALSHAFKFLFILNNDTVVPSDIISAFVAQMDENPQTGILGAKIFLYDERDKFDHLGGQWNSKKGSFDLVALREIDDGKGWELAQDLDYVCGCAFFVRRKVFEKIGLFEAKFFLIWEESDFCFRARKYGFKVQTCPKAKVWHKVSASFVGGKPHSTYFWWRNRLLWIERNCSKRESFSIYLRILIPDILHIFKLRLLKSLQLSLLRFVRPKENLKRREERNLKYRAALQGVRDYTLRRFGNGPSWLYQKDKTSS